MVLARWPAKEPDLPYCRSRWQFRRACSGMFNCGKFRGMLKSIDETGRDELMHNYDPKLLRKLAATYRARATTEPDRARVFLEIARDMEIHARRIEANRTAANQVQ